VKTGGGGTGAIGGGGGGGGGAHDATPRSTIVARTPAAVVDLMWMILPNCGCGGDKIDRARWRQTSSPLGSAALFCVLIIWCAARDTRPADAHWPR
jgi:hypothetical protein